MDYDDNEFQGQNSHIGGEGNSKFSPVSHPYALPKFDFDDGLQGHLRFDNLVENEGFLAIPSQEDNQWIEDFSRGSGSLVFSSSAPESCPTLRSNNVWSEAASSESVEMLLKSVGQEETVAIVEESDACQTLGSVAEQMESHIKEDGKTMNDTVSDHTLLSEKVADYNSVLNDIKGMSNSPGVEISTYRGSHMSSPNALSETRGVEGDGDNLDRRHEEEDLIDVDTSLNKTPFCGIQDPSGSNMHTVVEDTTSQDIIVEAVSLDHQESTAMVTDAGSDSASCLLTVSVEEAKEEDVITNEVQVDDENLKEVGYGTPSEKSENLLCSSSNSDVVELHPVEINVRNLDEPSGFTVSGSSDIQITKECGDDVIDSEPNKDSGSELFDLSNVAHIQHQIDENIQDNLPKDLQGDVNLVAHVIEVSTEKTESDVVNSLGEGKVLLQGNESQLLTEVSISNNEATMLSNLDNNVSNPQVDVISVVEHSSVTLTCLGTSVQEREYSVDKTNFGNDASGVQKCLSVEDLVSSPTVFSLPSNRNSVYRDQDVSSNGEEKLMFPNTSSEMEIEIIKPHDHVKEVGHSSVGESSKINNEAVRGSEQDAAARIEPDVTAEAPPFLYERGADDDLSANQTRENAKIEEVGSVETNLISLKETSKSTDKMDPVLEVDKCSAYNLTEELPQVAADHSLPAGGTSNTASESEQTAVIMNLSAGQPSLMAEISNFGVQAKEAEKTHQNSNSSFLNLDLFPSIRDPTSKQIGVADESAIPANHGAKDHILASYEVSDSVGPTPTNISCDVLNKSKSEKEKMVEESLVKSVPQGGGVEPTFKDARQSDVKEGKNFTFEVHLSSGVVEVTDQDKQSFRSFKETSPLTPSIGPVQPSTVLDPSRVSFQTLDPDIARGGSSGTPVRKRGRSKTPKTVVEPSCVSSQGLDLEIPHGGSTGTPVRKRGRPKGPGKQNDKNLSSLKETSSAVQSERGDNKSSVSTSSTRTGKLQFEAVKLHDKFEHSTKASLPVVPVVTPNLPDLNTSASPFALVRQPFSDMQQMQLRAQIFVYGSLIQGAAPDETCMVSAFGTSDGGRNMWEPVWRACVEKLQNVKSKLSKSETPLQPQIGASLPELSSTKKDALQSGVLLPPAGRPSFKETPSPVVNSMIPLSSPLWNVSTPFLGLQSPGMPRGSVFDYRQTLSPSPFQSPPLRNVALNNIPWPSHTSFPAPWITASQSSPFDPSARLPTAETLKITPVKESVPLATSSANQSFSSATVHHSGPSVSVEPNPLPMKKTTISSGQDTAEPKTRKRKKKPSPSDIPAFLTPFSQARAQSVPAPVPLFSHGQNELVPAMVVPSHLSTSVVVSTPPFFGSKGNDAKIVTIASPIYLADQPKRIEPNLEQTSCLPHDALIKDVEAKQQAEAAAKSAAAAVSHCQTVWDGLNKQNISGLTPEVEAKLASAAVAVATAAAVAKAAAAAAHVASNAASQAKIMADEAWISSTVDNTVFNSSSSISNTFNGDEGNSSSSILVAAKEAARKRVEAASFASKLAENLDAVLKAAELAASAASQAGTIVAMGDPPSLAKLIEAGPEGYWRTQQAPIEQVNEERSNIGIFQESPNVSGRHENEEPSRKRAKSTSRGLFSLSREVHSMENHVKGVEGMPTFFKSSEKDLKARRDSRDLDKTIGVVPESESGSRPTSSTAQDDYYKGMETFKGTSNKEGCLVEVKKEGNGFKEAWFSANLLSMENGKAFVAYTGSKSGSTELKEWVALGADGDNEPRLRIVQADTQFEGTKKRRRGAVGDIVWSVGDKVDVWIRECWREGVVTEKNRIDDSTLTVQFSADGETSVVRAWNLRPTLIWKDGEWIETSSSRQKDPFNKGDTPQEKRLKLGGPSMEGSKKDISQTFQFPEPERREELQLLPLSDKEKMFNVGDNTKKSNKPDAPRMVRSGLQKDGPRVVFDVSKPGKKKKFMEVSKHYVAESSSKTNKSREKYTMPKDDAKVKQQGEMKTRIPKPVKTISSFGRTLPQKDKFPSSAVPTKNEAKKSTSTDGSEPEQQKRSEFRSVSSTDRAAQGSFAFSSSALSRNMFTSNTRSERAKRGNRAPIAGKWAKTEGKDKIDSEKEIPGVSEPRRSNRRIQPTSRLLEGLQSSLTLTKFPSLAHDKGQRSHSKSTPKGKY